jgi:glycosyltransferase involved in cell wall biosynthesis/GT2 family glycosyltransferase
VIDNGPSAESLRIVSDIRNKTHHRILYAIEDKQGLSFARNKGILLSQGKVVAFLDDDEVANNDWLRQMLSIYQTDEKIGCVGGKIIPIFPNNEFPPWYSPDIKGFFGGVDNGDKPHEIDFQAEYLGGGNISFKRQLVSDLGMFRTDLGIRGRTFYSGEETELYMKVFKNGYKVYYNPHATTYHAIEKQRVSKKYLARRAFQNGISDAVYDYLSTRNRYTKSCSYAISTVSRYVLLLVKSGVSLIKRALGFGGGTLSAWLALCRSTGKIFGFFKGKQPEEETSETSFSTQTFEKPLSFFIVTYWHDPRFKKRTGGIIRMFSLADNLTKMGHRVTMVLPKLGFPKKQTIARVIEIPLVDISILRPIFFHLLSSLYLLWGLKDASVIYVRQMNSFLPLLIARLYRIPSVYEIPNDPFLAYGSRRLIRRIFEKLTDKAAMALSNRIVVLSEWSKKRLSKIGGIAPSKILVTPSGTDTNLFRPLDKIQCCKEIGIDPSFFYIGFIGSFLENQGVDVLINAAPVILDKYPSSRFLLVGDGPMMDDWKTTISMKGLQWSFIFTNRVPYEAVPRYVGAMDICVAPHHKETNQASPVKLFDYMACGRPIVASDIDVVREITQDNGCVLLTEPENPISLAKGVIRLLHDEKERISRGDLGRTLALSKYDRQRITLDLITNIRIAINMDNKDS